MRWTGLVALVVTLLLVGPFTLAQESGEVPSSEVAKPAQAAPSSAAAIPEAARAAYEVWVEALNRKPALVSLGSLQIQSQTADALQKSLRERLALLGRKKVSNRQWKDYWTKQQSLATALATALNQPSQAPRAAGLRAWAQLAADKLTNQDTYLEAIESERDAVEERLESSLAQGAAAEGAPGPVPATSDVDASPFRARQHHIAELVFRIHQQELKQGASEIAKKHSQRQTGTQGIMARALAADLALARLERAISEGLAGPGSDEWSRLWRGLHEGATAKVKSLGDEVTLGEQRVRSLEVELSLLGSQLTYRARKKAELEAELTEASSTSGWFVAVGETVLAWLRTSGWQVALMLLLLWMAVKVALRLIDTFHSTLLKAVEDDDSDDTSQEEARAQTIGSVFRSVARVGVIAVGALMALESVGVNTGPIMGSVAILGLAISFGSQSLVKDIVTGFFILLENQFAVGDVVTVSGQAGTVEDISLRTTRVREANGTLHVIPNGHISSVANHTRDWARVRVQIGVGYNSDLRVVEGLVNEVGLALHGEDEWAGVLEEAPAFVGVIQLGDSAVTVRVQARVKPGEQWSVERELNRRLLVAFNEANIEIPFPQQVVWHQNQAS